MKLFNQKPSDLRRSLYRQATEANKAVLKGTRWLLLKNPKNLDVEHNEKRRLTEALKPNRSLATAYYMKDGFRQFWEPGMRFATMFLDGWLRRAKA